MLPPSGDLFDSGQAVPKTHRRRHRLRRDAQRIWAGLSPPGFCVDATGATSAPSPLR